MFNRAILAGRLTRDPELKHLESGTSVCSFGLAVNSYYKEKETVLFIDISVFGKVAENCDKYLEKGSPVLVEGELKLDRWETDDGTRSKIKLIARTVKFLGFKGRSEDDEDFEEDEDYEEDDDDEEEDEDEEEEEEDEDIEDDSLDDVFGDDEEEEEKPKRKSQKVKKSVKTKTAKRKPKAKAKAKPKKAARKSVTKSVKKGKKGRKVDPRRKF